MKKRLIALLLLAGLFLGMVPTAMASSYTAFDEPYTLPAAAASVVLYKEAKADESILNKVVTIVGASGKEFTVLGESGDYFYVEFRSYAGFAAKSDLAESAAPAPAGEEAGERSYFPFEAVALDKTINMRAEPDGDTIKKCSNVRGEAFTILAEEGDWYLAQYEDTQGYVRRVDFCGFTADVSGFVFTDYAELTESDEDIWGHIKVDGTFIDYPIYCNALNSKGTDYYYNKDYFSIFTLSAEDAPIAVVMGHNTRKRAGTDKSMLHDLHHLQNVYLGIEECEYCGAKVAGTDTEIQISYNGCEDWSLCCFYELDDKNLPSAALRGDIKNYNALNSGLEGEAKQEWIDYQLLLAYQYGVILDDDMDSGDKIMIIITCADKTGNDDQSFYLVLRGND